MEVRCILCGQVNCVNLDVEDGKTFHCTQCDETFDAGDVDTAVNNWLKVLAWAEHHPARKDENKPIA